MSSVDTNTIGEIQSALDSAKAGDGAAPIKPDASPAPEKKATPEKPGETAHSELAPGGDGKGGAAPGLKLDTSTEDELSTPEIDAAKALNWLNAKVDEPAAPAPKTDTAAPAVDPNAPKVDAKPGETKPGETPAPSSAPSDILAMAEKAVTDLIGEIGDSDRVKSVGALLKDLAKREADRAPVEAKMREIVEQYETFQTRAQTAARDHVRGLIDKLGPEFAPIYGDASKGKLSEAMEAMSEKLTKRAAAIQRDALATDKVKLSDNDALVMAANALAGKLTTPEAMKALLTTARNRHNQRSPAGVTTQTAPAAPKKTAPKTDPPAGADAGMGAIAEIDGILKDLRAA